MYTAGIDIGLENIKIVILKDASVAASLTAPSGGKERGKRAEALYDEALLRAGVSRNGIHRTLATGAGKFDADFADGNIVEEIADAAAARYFLKDASAAVDIGADQTRVVSIGADGAVTETVRNQKCMAGLGLALEYMAERLDFSIEEISLIPPERAEGVTVNDGCPVFAELDALELLNIGVPRDAVAGAVTRMTVVRLNSVLRDKDFPDRNRTVLTGGVAKNRAVTDALKALSGIDFVIPESPEYGTALGAALKAAD
ncbi:MAG: acyl-CoA dehydratase activase [Clostridiales Family XIII bacterium]|jgi:benzoyl-CoA reductase subunit D|nr:acyl-CoA dehydratase activase [Clostridiales Family XIII bacterium]